ncbi:hypothetical protein AAGS61_15720 [Lysinibacillus sp. KU-BSD001]|uniref:hypothetical protein n=1 Tax=Lysinibacillus sp. KU-BSD001 TaxID=3141328 RepID=UPI0036E9B528
MLASLSKTIWMHICTIWSKPTRKTSSPLVDIHPVQQQTMRLHETFCPIRRNMY